MFGSTALLVALLSASAAGGRAPGPALRADGPSFSCAGRPTPTEALICGNAELGAYDRALAFAQARLRPSRSSRIMDQRAWLQQRDACGGQRSCVLQAYRDRVRELDLSALAWPSLRRLAARPDGSDLMLGTLQSPRGRVRRLRDSGELHIRPLGGEWYLFQASAGHLYDPHDALGANVSTSEAAGLVHLENGSGTFVEDPTVQDSCSIRFRRLRGGTWRLEETGSCSGLGSSLSGTYGR